MTLSAVAAIQEGALPKPWLLGFESLRDWITPKGWKHIAGKVGRSGGKFVILPLFPKKAPFALQINDFWCALTIRLFASLTGAGIVHGQSHSAAAASARALKRDRQRKLVFEVHGADIEERVADGRLVPGSNLHRLHQSLQKRALGRADWIVAVTASLRDHLLKDGAPVARTVVLPCVSTIRVADEVRRSAARQKLGVAQRQVVMYLGGGSDWQAPELIVASFAAVRRIHPTAVFLILTGDRDIFCRLAAEAGLPDYSVIIRSVRHDEVSSIGVAADVGLLLRKDTLVNRVASPTKFAEYLAMGVPVVLSDAMEDFAKLVCQENLGRVVAASAGPEEIGCVANELVSISPQAGEAMRRRCRRIVQERLSFERAVESYRSIYETAKEVDAKRADI